MGGEGSGRKPDPLKQFIPQRAGIATIQNNNLELPNYSGMKKFIDTHDVITVPPSVSFGTDGQVPFMNATNDDFSYDSYFYWDDSQHALKIYDTDGEGLFISKFGMYYLDYTGSVTPKMFGYIDTTNDIVKWEMPSDANKWVFDGGNFTLSGGYAFTEIPLAYTDEVGTNGFGLITKGGNAWLHDFSHSTGNTAIPQGNNICLGEGAGNLTMGSTATATAHASNNVFIGSNAGNANTIGYGHVAIGTDAMKSNTNKFGNVAIGAYTMPNNTSGYYNTLLGMYCMNQSSSAYGNTLVGYQVGYQITTGYNNVGVGYYTINGLRTGVRNTAIGEQALRYNQGGHYNIALGYLAGNNISSGSVNTTSTDGIYIGRDTRANALSETNQIVIGATAIGNGSNTITLGNTSITDTYITAGDLHLVDSGAVVLGTGNDAGIWYDGTNLHIDAQLVGSGTIILDNLPTSSAGLPTGAVWNNSNVLNIV